MKKTLLIIALFCSTMLTWANDYSLYLGKAQRAFDQKEWASASALFGLVLDINPSESQTYGHAIVASAMRNDTISQLQLMHQAIAHHVPFDSTFAAVKKVSFLLADGSLYEQFLLLVQRNTDWLSRAIDSYLLDYYVYRNNAPQIIHYSQLMLKGLPNDVKYLTLLADALMLDSQTDKAVATYNSIVTLDPANYHAHLALGNYYALNSGNTISRQKALTHLQHAQNLRPTPHIADIIKQLNGF